MTSRNIVKKLFQHIGKSTPLAIRFSLLQERGGTDLGREVRGYAVKFYTEEGNWDIVGCNIPVYFYKDGQYIVGLIHALKRNPVTGLRDYNALFDFILHRPESLHEFLWIFSDIGIPDGYRHMSGFSVHTYELVNEHGESHFARFHFITDQGIKNILSQQALQLGARDPDYATRDLYNSIANGSFPSWTMYIEVMTKEQVEKADFDPFDVTSLWPKGRYPCARLEK
ncbi:Peroxisomal catalase 1 [Eumeta japonica]|uniref:Peroxisomal catalase 1 n=1 Tax=Eumeta variegata TaxID=151549 RepID=A0A4C2A5L6_EUMVA|nr:Peroxisomal catalase 1 [Eumeta japonica]